MMMSLFWIASFSVAHEGHHHNPMTQAAKVMEAAPTLKSVYDSIHDEYNLNIKSIFQAKCAACHSADISAPWYASIPLAGRIVENDRREAKQHLEISKGFPFAGHGDVDEDFKSLKETVEKDTMPTRLYRLMHPSSGLNDLEKKQILKWIEDSQRKISDIGTENGK